MNLRNFLKFCIFLIIFIFCNSFYCYSKGNVNLNKDLQYKFYNFKLNKDNMFEFLRNPTVEFLNKNYDRVITYILGDFNTKSIGTGKNITTNIKAILNNGFETKEYYPENTGIPLSVYETKKFIQNICSTDLLKSILPKECGMIRNCIAFQNSYTKYEYHTSCDLPFTIWIKTEKDDYYLVPQVGAYNNEVIGGVKTAKVYTKDEYLKKFSEREYTVFLKEKEICTVRYIGETGYYPLKNIVDNFKANLQYDKDTNSLKFNCNKGIYTITIVDGIEYVKFNDRIDGGSFPSVQYCDVYPKEYLITTEGDIIANENFLQGILSFFGAQFKVNNEKMRIDIIPCDANQDIYFDEYFDEKILEETNKKFLEKIALKESEKENVKVEEETEESSKQSIEEVNKTSTLDDDSIKVKLNGEFIEFDQEPIIEEGRTLVPFRAILEKMGILVSWDSNSKTIICQKDQKIISLTVGAYEIEVNGKKGLIDVPAKIYNERTLVPIRVISECFDAEVNWDLKTRTVEIKTVLEG